MRYDGKGWLATLWALLGLAGPGAWAAPLAPPAYTAGAALDFKPGSAKARAALSRLPDLRELVAERFVMASVDLDDDGRPEMVVLSESGSFCGSSGCQAVVLAQQGQRIVRIGGFYNAGSLAVTQEKLRGYRALASVDEKGAIQVLNKPGDPRHGKPVVFAMDADAPTAAAPGAAAPAAGDGVAAGAAAAAPVPEGAADDARAASVLGIRLGMPAAQAEALVRKHAATYNGTMEVRKYNYKAKCTGCPPYEFRIEASHGVANRAPGNIAKEALLVNLSPASEGARVISVVRRVSFKEQLTRESLVGQLVARHGKPGFNEPQRVVWYLDERHIANVPRSVKYPSGMGTFLCSSDPESPASLFKQVLSGPDEYRRTGISEPLHAGCGTVMTLDMAQSGPGYVNYLYLVLIDHRAYGNAAVAAADMLSGQQRATDAKVREEVRARPAPTLN